jgi:prepilin-type processing-associated H-X9-DG protein
VELIVALALIAILIGLLLPTAQYVRTVAVKTACASNLRQIGTALTAYTNDFDGQDPKARAIPAPFESGDTDPPLTEKLSSYIDPQSEETHEVYHCPGDDGHVFARSGCSYQYEILLGGETIDSYFAVEQWGLNPAEVWVSRDFDHGTFDLEDGSTVEVPFFHETRNLLFADGHVGDFP